MKNNLIVLFFMLSVPFALAQSNKVSVEKSADGFRLVANGQTMMVNGVNWDYVPIGNGILDKGIWAESDDIIRAALDAEMALFKNMGVNAIRTYGLEPKWITYIYENYGIYTMLNTQFGAYGLTINGAWVPQTDYTDPATREVLMKEVTDMANKYKDTPGLLLYMVGNENNYHLSWTGAETEAIPIDGVDPGIRLAAEGLYKAFNDAALAIKGIDNSVPVAICNGDLLYLDIVKQYCKDIDIYGTNMYRGISFGDAFQRVNDELDKPILFAEFGADAFNAIENKEDQYSQAYYNVGNWKDIYQNAAGLGKTGNSIGGFTFQSSDGWWKWNQTKDFDVHNTIATWPNGGYSRDLAPGGNNMNEEWFGICAKGPTNERGLYDLYPRAAYYALKEVHQLNPYDQGMNMEFVENYFNNINLMDAVLKARGDKAALEGGSTGKLGISRLRAEFTTFNTGGSLITTPETEDPNVNQFPNQLGFDHMQSYFVGIEGKPSSNMRANVDFNILGNVAENPINEIFYENAGRPVTVTGVDGGNNVDVEIADFNRLRVYQAEFEWNAKDFDLRGFYRTGHYHWAYEGDFFNLYPEANYGPNLDIYNGEILGIEVDAKGELDGLKAAFGPQLWWGANPTMLLKYSRKILDWDVTGIYHRDLNTDLEFDETGRRVLDANQVRSGIIPAWPQERATIAIERDFGSFGVTVGGIWGGSPLNGSSFQMYEEDNDVVVVDKVQGEDNWGAKAKVTYQSGPFNWYAQGSYMGLVANGGVDQTRTFTGWRLLDSGSGNMTNFLSGFTYTFGDLQIAPNFMWQKPLVDPMPNGVPGPGRLRNVIDDPFAVRGGNRETTAGEILLTFDPTPGTWMYEWNNDRAEDAKFAFNLGFVYRHLPTTQDAHIGFLADRTFFAFGESAPAEDLWEAHTRIVSKLSPDLGIIGNFYYGNGQGNGDSDRTITRFGGDLRLLYKKIKVMSHIRVNDWGPFDYHRDFNLTFPLQLMLDVSTTLGKPDWFILPSTQVGIRGMWRSLDEFSPRFSPLATDPNATNPNTPPILSPVGFPNGSEWEIRTYIHINIGK
ncbi:glycoside hydrolase family 2 TIM barrel-domain containing protein [Winogradskyella sp.]|uniref:glycoside hydrolase family 2 TIM barrel-domain containing protein n=1 Tax=Winogradskyella sp. TaxID=1883156 RepID=UPI0026271C96|nr:glycoside hydrolase family 2 TIM barrel-domain containing protein [Winogradskyella sp.]